MHFRKMHFRELKLAQVGQAVPARQRAATSSEHFWNDLVTSRGSTENQAYPCLGGLRGRSRMLRAIRKPSKIFENIRTFDWEHAPEVLPHFFSEQPGDFEGKHSRKDLVCFSKLEPFRMRSIAFLASTWRVGLIGTCCDWRVRVNFSQLLGKHFVRFLGCLGTDLCKNLQYF